MLEILAWATYLGIVLLNLLRREDRNHVNRLGDLDRKLQLHIVINSVMVKREIDLQFQDLLINAVLRKGDLLHGDNLLHRSILVADHGFHQNP